MSAPPAQPPAAAINTNGVRGGRATNGGDGPGRRGRGRGGRGGGRGRGNARGGFNTALSGTIEEHDHINGTIVNGVGPAAPTAPTGGRRTHPPRPPTAPRLRADAPAFIPNQVFAARPGRAQQQKNTAAAQPVLPTRPRRESIAKSQAPDLGTRTQEDIANNAYECAICTSEVTATAKIWSCKTCWTVFHLTCIKKWATNDGSAQARPRNEEGIYAEPRQWRCPGCNLPKDAVPGNYMCWCEKEYDPRPVPGMPPHSCGQTCSKARTAPKSCPHPCELLCHAGPCSPCSRMGPKQQCFCGKETVARKCVDTDYESGWGCESVCGKRLACGEHSCERPCHEGQCGACEELMPATCYCGKEEKEMLCSAREEAKYSEGEKESWIGVFDCGQTCDKAFDCGVHQCQKRCHPQDVIVKSCPQSPQAISHCQCGQTKLDEMQIERKSCADPIPTCQKQCSKPLACGHACPSDCHSGACDFCRIGIDITCGCGRTTSTVRCYEQSQEAPKCSRQCRATMSCGRHECGEKCCTGERRASERKRLAKHLSATQIAEIGIEAEHICTRACGRMLKCGNHTCPELCHRGPCGNCREAIFDELSCHCGRSVLQPPLPCGTSSPVCRFECNRPTACGHPRIAHNCHNDDTACPKCPFLGEKRCICGKKTLKNQPCFVQEPRCGDICGKTLRCGSHKCRKQCHRPGECEDVGSTCEQTCGKTKKACGHFCEEKCHAPSMCREEKPCSSKTLVTCECQHRKQEVKCHATKSGAGNGKKTLPCDDECARMARNAVLAEALNIDPATHTNDHIPYSNETLKIYRQNLSWAQAQEREMRIFAADETERQKRYKPLPARQRGFIHSLAEDFGFDSESVDPEPHRHVVLFKTPRFVKAPMKTLAECVRIRNTQATTVAEESAHRIIEPFNGFLLNQPRFALTESELRSSLQPAFDSTPGLSYSITFLPNDQISVLASPASASTSISPASIEASLKYIKPRVQTLISTPTPSLAASCTLCAIASSSPSSTNITRSENAPTTSSDGWSQVAAKGAAPRTAPTPWGGIGSKTGYAVLSSSSVKKRKKMREEVKMMDEEVVEDWEAEVVREEEEQATKLKTEKEEVKEENDMLGRESEDETLSP